ncbi:MAG: alanine--tRNA ligase [Alphaproteobacteria bacterium]|nr:alanine--tRNA ligase [Alphaproteobacteria bacterium]
MTSASAPPKTAATLSQIRAAFLDTFRASGHTIVPSAPLVPRNDPTLMFTNAGMVPFKDVFTGAETRGYARAASAQKCVRAGGKHNDLDNVGYTARHHTFFEMLGNFSFGDYFKEEAIAFAWQLVTGEFGLARDRLLVTVYAEDEEAFGLWRRIAGLPEDRIIRIGTSDNFWSMGDTGPCGPCSEIFYDHGAHIPGGPPGSPEADGDRFVEVWNLVFMQFDQKADGTRIPLPRPSIDTGMGLERIAAVLQGTHDNYATDLFRTLIAASSEVSRTPAHGAHAASHRVIADHLRATSFLIADGVLPSNEGRGYVLRRIMRRAMRHAHILGAREPMLHRLVPVLRAEMGAAYPELGRAEALITETLKLEESRFQTMLERGLRILDEETQGLGAGDRLPGEIAFRLYDTFGFPLDLTEDALRARRIGVDTDGFKAAMARQRAEARAAWAGSGEAATESLWFELREAVGPTDFLGYATGEAEARLLAIVRDGKPVASVSAGEDAQLIVNQSPFYAESGGQAGDTGSIFTPDGAEVEITDTLKRVGDLHVHVGHVRRGRLSVGDVVSLQIDGERRAQLRANHSATHLLHAALRNRLGPHVTQKGSLVAADRLRFDFSHPKGLTAEDLAAVETEVNTVIRQNDDVLTRVMTPEAAIEAGALALFGEKYGEEVRVLTMGRALEAGSSDRPYSVELCGGTHVTRTGDIALFKVVGEGAVASGVRRIEALTGEAARRHLLAQEARLREVAGLLRTSVEDVPARIEALVAERKRLERELSEARKAAARGGGAAAGATGPSAREVNGVKLVASVLDGVPAKELRGMVDEAKTALGSGVVAFVSVVEGKAALAVGVTSDLTGRFSAVDLVKAAAQAVGGQGGGGRPDLAQAGGPDGANAQASLEALESALATG